MSSDVRPMANYHSDTYGDRLAADYDAVFASFDATDDQLHYLTALADGGRVLEIGVGTGRVAIPLAALGVPVVGVDSSLAMLQHLSAAADRLPITGIHGDIRDVDLTHVSPVSLVYAVFNTFFMLPGAVAQGTCLTRLHNLLVPSGSLVVEVFVPHPERFVNDQQIHVKTLDADQVFLQVSRHYAREQRVDSQDIRLRNGAPVELFPTQVHYLWPDQLDALAATCGFELEARHADWSGAPFTAESRNHVSVYRRGAQTDPA